MDRVEDKNISARAVAYQRTARPTFFGFATSQILLALSHLNFW